MAEEAAIDIVPPFDDWQGLHPLFDTDSNLHEKWKEAFASASALEEFVKQLPCKYQYTYDEDAAAATSEDEDLQAKLDLVTAATSVEALISACRQLDVNFGDTVSTLFQAGQLSIWVPDGDQGEFPCPFCDGKHKTLEPGLHNKKNWTSPRLGGKKLSKVSHPFALHELCFKNAVDEGRVDAKAFNYCLAQPLGLPLSKRTTGHDPKEVKRIQKYRSVMKQRLMPLAYWKWKKGPFPSEMYHWNSFLTAHLVVSLLTKILHASANSTVIAVPGE